jgi:hypothetical protein
MEGGFKVMKRQDLANFVNIFATALQADLISADDFL